jgi:choline-sulfatase
MTALPGSHRMPNHLHVFLLIFLSTAAGSGFSAALAAEPVARTNVLLITVDTVRADHLGYYGYRSIATPNIDQLAREGIWFERAYAQVPLTLPSHAVILTGTYPMYNTVRDFTGVGLPPNIGILSEAFERQGYATAAFVSAFVLDGSWGLRRGFQNYDDVFDAKQFETQTPGNIQRRAEETVNHFLAWFSARPAKPFFVWLHLYDPHSPYDPPEPFRSKYAGHLYDGEIAYCDEQLGRVFTALGQASAYDHTLIVFLSDHGESLGEHGEDEHGFFLYGATLHVPLIIKTPRGIPATARRVDTVVGTIDVAPTIVQLLGFRDPLVQQFQGNSLASLLMGKASTSDRTAYAETYYPRNSFGWSPLTALVGSRFSFIDAPRPELYDLAKDPHEKVNLYASQRAEANALKAQLEALAGRYTAPAASTGGPPLSAETQEKLKSLGYIAYSAPPAGPDASGNLPDPKDKIRTYRAILRASDLAQTGHPAQADRVLDGITQTDSTLYLIPFMLAENALRDGRLKEAQRQFLACLRLNPEFSQAIMGAARAYHADHQNDKAKPLLELALHQNPHNFLAAFALGVIAAEEKRLAEAQSYFEAAAHDKPNYGPAYQELGIAQVGSQRYSDAVPNLERARALSPPNSTLLNYLAIALGHAGDPHKAVGLYLQALELKPDYTGARLNLAMAYKNLGDRENARRQFKILCDSGSSLCEQFRQAFEQ